MVIGAGSANNYLRIRNIVGAWAVSVAEFLSSLALQEALVSVDNTVLTTNRLLIGGAVSAFIIAETIANME